MERQFSDTAKRGVGRHLADSTVTRDTWSAPSCSIRPTGSLPTAMAIPPFQRWLLPALKTLGNGQVWTPEGMSEALATSFDLTADDKAQMLPSGVRPRYRDRSIWALTYLLHAGLAQRPTRGKYEISPTGIALLESHPREITQRFLIDNYPSFRELKSRTSREPATSDSVADSLSALATPSDRFEAAFAELRASLIGDLLGRLSSLSPSGFERTVLEVLRAMGYAADEQSIQHTGQTGDGGIDGIIYQDPMGLDRVYVQAKNWANPVSGPDLSQFVGAMDLQGASKGVFVTRSSFTTQAKEFADMSVKRIVLVDGHRFATLMIQYGVGVTTVRSYSIGRVDADFFEGTDE